MAVKSTKESHDRSCDKDEYLPEKPQEPLPTDCCSSGNQTRYKLTQYLCLCTFVYRMYAMCNGSLPRRANKMARTKSHDK